MRNAKSNMKLSQNIFHEVSIKCLDTIFYWWFILYKMILMKLIFFSSVK